MPSYEPWETFVADIKGKMERGELIPDPDWQRGYIWGLRDEQLLIDSIIRGLPIPKFYLTQEYDPAKGISRHAAVDGQQRLKAIFGFLTNRFSIETKNKRYLFRELDSQTQEKITNYKLNGHYMTDFTQRDINFLFQRLNRTGIKLTNMEVWNNEYYQKKILSLVREIYEEIWQFPHKRDYRDYSDEDLQKLENSYVRPIYTDENIKRMLPLDDIIDLSNCLLTRTVEGGGKKELENFLHSNKSISAHAREAIKSKFRKTLNNMRLVLTKQDLEASNYSKRTHFIGLYLAFALSISNYYVLGNVANLRKRLLDFIDDPPPKYIASVLGQIRKKAPRQLRVTLLQNVILKQATKLDKKRTFDPGLKRKFWRRTDHICQICKKEIRAFDDAVLDHKNPWQHGGKTEEANAQLAHKRCSASKNEELNEFVILE
jgi:hypothetical protein